MSLVVVADDLVCRPMIARWHCIGTRDNGLNLSAPLRNLRLRQWRAGKLLGNSALHRIRDRLTGAFGKLTDHAIGFFVSDQHSHGEARIYEFGGNIYALPQ